MEQIERYWLFTSFVLVIAVMLMRLVLRERITLQSSLSFLTVLVAMIALSIFPDLTWWLTTKLRFTLASNLIFAVSLGALGLLHVFTLVTLARVELRSQTSVQELALLEEKIVRLSHAQELGDGRKP